MAAAPQQEIREVVELLRQVTGEDEEWAAGITPATRVDTDLLIDSVEFAALALAVRERHGADLAAYVAGLDLPELIELTVGDLAAYVGDPRR